MPSYILYAVKMLACLGRTMVPFDKIVKKNKVSVAVYLI
jgi:hypothetical protein